MYIDQAKKQQTQLDDNVATIKHILNEKLSNNEISLIESITSFLFIKCKQCSKPTNEQCCECCDPICPDCWTYIHWHNDGISLDKCDEAWCNEHWYCDKKCNQLGYDETDTETETDFDDID